MRWDIGMDLGTEFVRTAEYKQGAALETAAKLALRDGRETPICCGDVAARIAGRTCEGVEVVSPLKDGVLENNFYADRLFRWIYNQSDGVGKAKRFGAMITCAPFARPVQQEAMLTAAMDAGAAEAALVRSDVAAAVGAGLDLHAPEAKLVVDIGAGKVTATLFTFGRIAAFGYLPYGLNRIDERIQRIVRTEGGYRIGMGSAREIKHTLGTALPEAAPKDIIMHMTGFSLERRLPEAFDVETAPVLHACEEVVREIAGLCANVVAEIPEELSADLNDAGATLVGGGAELTGLDKRIGDTLGIPCRIADAPSKCAARGLFEIMRAPEKYENAVLRHARKGGR
ncbi:MAG: rod shape-determining protein [Clostridia bacterium]|nr:rod shape-determining protein [Clostridia bacterium]